MDDITRTQIENFRSKDKQQQNDAYFAVIAATDQPVPWAYEIWDDMLAGLTDRDNHVRAIAAQVLSNLAKSDPDQRMLKDFAPLLEVTKDDRFVTARHCMQSLWKVGVVGDAQRQVYLDGLERRFHECIAEKNCTMIRYDICQSMRNVYDATHDEQIRERVLALIETEQDAKYKKKYMTLWRK